MKYMNPPKTKVTGRLWLSFGLLIIVLVLSLVIFYWQTQRIDSALVDVITREEPLERIALQMQLNINTTAQAASYYVRNRDSADAKKVHDSEVSFVKLSQEFNRLVHTSQINRIGQEITRLYDEFRKSTSDTIMLTDNRYAVVLLFTEDVEVLNDLINGMLPIAVEEISSNTTKKLNAMLRMQSSLNEVSTAINAYMVEPDPQLLEQFQEARVDFKQASATYRDNSLSSYENSWLNHINQRFEEATSAGIEIIQITDKLYVLLEQFNESYGELDSYLSNEVIPLVHLQAIEASENIQAASDSAGNWLVILGVIAFLIAGVSIWIMSRNITNPIRKLAEGAAIVSNGKLAHRFNIDAKGEFGEIAIGLNQMLDSLGRSKDALGESEELAWTLLDATNDACILTDNRGVILASNEVAASRFGRSLEQMVDESIYDLLPAGPAASMKAHVAEVIRSKKPAHYEEEREGKIIDHNLYPAMGNKGEISRIAIFSRDITIRKWVEDVSEQLGRRNELILKAAGEGIYGLDRKGKTTFVNPAAARMLGYEPEELIGQYHHEMVHHSKPDGRPYPTEECLVHAAFMDGAVHTNVDDEVFWRKDGTSFPVEYTSTPIIEDGRILGAVVTFQDITDRKRIEKVLRQSEERYRSIFESTTSLIISVDEKGTIVDCNARIQHTLGYSPNEIIGQNLLDFISPEEQTKVSQSLEDALTTGFKYDNELKMARKDGTFIDINMNLAAVSDANGAYVRTICMIEKVTQRLRR